MQCKLVRKHACCLVGNRCKIPVPGALVNYLINKISQALRYALDYPYRM